MVITKISKFFIICALLHLTANNSHASQKTLATFEKPIESKSIKESSKVKKIGVIRRNDNSNTKKIGVIKKYPKKAQNNGTKKLIKNIEKTKFKAPEKKVFLKNLSGINNKKSHFDIHHYVDGSIKNSPDVQERLANKEESENLVQQSYRSILPTVTARAGTGSQYSDSSAAQSKKLGSDELSLDVHQNIFGEGRVSDLNVNKSVFNAKVYELEQIKNLVTLSTLESYLNVIRYSIVVKVQRQSIESHLETLQKTRTRLNAGLMRASDLLLTQARTASAKSNLTSTLAQLDRAKHLLYRYSGIKVKGELEDMGLPTGVPKNFKSAWGYALKNNPIIKAKYHEVKTSDHARKKENIKLYPSLSLDLSAQKTYDSAGVDGVEEDLSAMLNMNYEFNFGSKFYQKSAAGSRLKSTRYSYEKSKSDIYQSLSSLYTDYEQINERIDFLKGNRDYLENVVKKHQKEFEAGFRSLLDLLNTKSEFFNADIQYVNALYDRKIMAYTILANTGNLLTYFGK